MITINDKSSRTPIFIERDILNKNEKPSNDYVNSDELDEILSGYITEDELQEILKEYNSIPYIVVDGSSFSGFEITIGDWGAVHNAIQNNKPYLIYANSSNTGTIFSLVDDISPHPQGGASIATTLITANRKVTYRGWIIDINGNVELTLEETYTIQPKLVSGENIKTINGNDILGEGDIIIESGTDIPYLYVLQNGEMVGDFDAVYDAVKNKKPYLLYIYSFNNTIFYNSLAESVETNGDKIKCSDVVIVATDGGPKLSYKVLSIGKDGVTVEIYEEKILPTEFKTINSNSILGSGNITVQPSLVSGTNIKTINGSSLLGSGDITIVGSGSEILYLYKATDDTAVSTHKNHNISIRNKILSLTNTEQYPIIILKDWYNDTICNNVYAKDDYVEIQCCNSRIFGEYSELTDERYELNNKGVLVKLEGNTFASKAYVDEQVSNVSGGGGSTDLSNYYTKGEIDNMVGDIETILDNLIGNN